MAFLSLLPMRPRPLKDENLDSWAMRLAHANAVTATYFMEGVLGIKRFSQLDSSCRNEIFKALEVATGLPYSTVADTSFHHTPWKIAGKVYFEGKEVIGSISFHLAHYQAKGLLKYSHRVCPLCWRNDEIPYIRKKWRLRFWKTCPVHNTFLIEKCQNCARIFKSSYRHYSKINNYGENSICICPSCRSDIRHQEQNVENQREFIATAALENFYWELLEAQSFSCKDAVKLIELRKIMRQSSDVYPPVTILVPGFRGRPTSRDVTSFESWVS